MLRKLSLINCFIFRRKRVAPDCGVESIKYHQGHWHVSDNWPDPLTTIKVDPNDQKLNPEVATKDGGFGTWIGKVTRIVPVCLQTVDRPHRQVANRQEGHDLSRVSTRLLFHLFGAISESRKVVKLNPEEFNTSSSINMSPISIYWFGDSFLTCVML